MIPHNELTPGYYWASYGGYDPEIVRIDYKRKRSINGKYVVSNELELMFFGLSDRVKINIFTFYKRINYEVS